MSRLLNINYSLMANQAQKIEETGLEINDELISIYTNIENMHNSWKGDRYNSLVKSFNNLIPQLNNLTKLLVEEMPFVLKNICNDYSQVDINNDIIDSQKNNAKQIKQVEIINGEKLKYISSGVIETQKNVSKSIVNIVDKLDLIEKVVNSIEWSSDVCEMFKDKFSKVKQMQIVSFNNINSQFKEIIDQTTEYMNQVENANNV